MSFLYRRKRHKKQTNNAFYLFLWIAALARKLNPVSHSVTYIISVFFFMRPNIEGKTRLNKARK